MKLLHLVAACALSASALPGLEKASTDLPALSERSSQQNGPLTLADQFRAVRKRAAPKNGKRSSCYPSRPLQPFHDWKTYTASGTNLGGWLVLEKGLQPSFFNDNGASAAIDEWSFCDVLGREKCGKLLEERYATFFTTEDIDLFASYGINTLRIPVGYWAFMDPVNGDTYYHGNQLKYLANIANYAIQEKAMHVIIDIHALPGGQNGLDNQGKSNDLYWWHNQTNFDYSLDLIRLATQFIQNQPQPGQYTLGVINEPLMQGSAFFGQTNESIAYLNKFYTASLDIVRKMDPSKTIPVMLSDGFSGAPLWDQWWGNSDQNIVFDTHIYYFNGGSYPQNAPYDACYLAKSYENATNPVFIGEWSIQATDFNTIDVDTRKKFFYSQKAAYEKYLNGGSFWNGKHFGTNVVGTNDGSLQPSYWSFEKLIEDGVVVHRGKEGPIATCSN